MKNLIKTTLLNSAVKKYKERIAVGVDVKDGYVATHGWTVTSDVKCEDFIEHLQKIGVDTVICTDISKDGAMNGTNLDLYRKLSRQFKIKIVASGGVCSYEDIKELTKIGVFGAIVGKALYNGAVDLKSAIELAKETEH